MRHFVSFVFCYNTSCTVGRVGPPSGRDQPSGQAPRGGGRPFLRVWGRCAGETRACWPADVAWQGRGRCGRRAAHACLILTTNYTVRWARAAMGSVHDTSISQSTSTARANEHAARRARHESHGWLHVPGYLLPTHRRSAPPVYSSWRRPRLAFHEENPFRRYTGGIHTVAEAAEARRALPHILVRALIPC